MIVAGIDEAGYGPRLGPLVVAANSLRLSGAAMDPRGWPSWSLPDAGLAVCDSKEAYSSARGIECLETPVLAFAGARRAVPRSLAEFVGTWAVDGGPEALSRPWYSFAPLALPCGISSEKAALAALRLAEALAGKGVEYLGASICVVDAVRYNKIVERVGNKATLLFGRAAILMWDIWSRLADEEAYVTVDRHGGRKFYGALLDVAFPECEIGVVSEAAEESVYRISDGRRRMFARFVVNGEAADPATALSSMWAKYTRELFMRLFNLYWVSRADGIKVTAGYWTDGERFLADLLAAGVVTSGEAQEFTRSR